MQTAFTSVVPMRGDLRIVVRYADTGKVHWRYEIRNTITYAALGNLVTLIAQKTFATAGDLNDPQNSAISYLRVGDVNTTPARTNTNLLGVIMDPLAPTVPYTVTLGDFNKTLTTSNPFEAKFTATIPGTDLVGETLREAGLFTRGSTTSAPPGLYSGFYPELFARQVHPDILVNAAFVIDYDWRIAFTS